MKKLIDKLALVVSILAISYLLNGCIPTALGVLNAVGRATDGTTVSIYQNGIEFMPVGTKQDVVLSIIGQPVIENDEHCVAKADGVVCIVDVISETTVFNVTGTNLAVWASWIQDGELIARFQIVK